MAFPALLDTCVLFPQYLCDTLLTQAYAGTFRPLWSEGILQELDRVLVRETRMSGAQVAHRLARMRAAFPDAEVTGYEQLIEGMRNHEKDRHVLAAAVRANAEVLVTFNVKDFPDDATRPFELTVVTPDDFLLDQLDLHPAVVLSCLDEQVNRYIAVSGPTSVSELAAVLERACVPRFAAEVRRNVLS